MSPKCDFPFVAALPSFALMTKPHSIARYIATVFMLCLSAAYPPIPAQAQGIGQSMDDVVQVSILEGWRVSEIQHMAAIQIDLAPGWKTYWRAPGEGGVPTRLRLTHAQEIAEVRIHWPTPEVFLTNGIQTIGYQDQVVLPLEFTLATPGAIDVAGRLDLGVCFDVCMPITVSISATLSESGTRVAAIQTALMDTPIRGAEVGARPPQCGVEPISDGMRAHVTVEIPPLGQNEIMVVEHRDAAIWVSDSVSWRQGNVLNATVDIVPPDAGPFALDRSALRLTIIGGQRAVELAPCTG